MTSGAGPTGAGLAAVLRTVAAQLPNHRDALNRLDAVAGDGDLGLTVGTAAAALLELAPSLEAIPEPEAIRRAGLELARRAPSTGGTLIAFALMAAAKAEIDPGAPDLRRADAYLAAAAASVAARGQVQPGDRTMLDALAPAAAAFHTAVEGGADAATAISDAARAAHEGASATATMTARVGRAGWLSDRAAGHEDAGARLVAMVLAAVAGDVGAAGDSGQVGDRPG